MPAVSNSSPLIALAAIDRLELLPTLFQSIVIPPAVAHEIRRSVSLPAAWLHVRTLEGPLPETVLRRSLADGEREAIALALETRPDRIILDDLPARQAARTFKRCSFWRAAHHQSAMDIDFRVAAGRGCIHRCDDVPDMQPQNRPSRVTDNNDGNLPAGQVLLMPNVLVRGDQEFKTGRFSRGEQVAVAECVPPFGCRLANRMALERIGAVPACLDRRG